MEILKLKLKDVSESPNNPRQDFDKAKLLELGADMQSRGQLQPIVVRKDGKGHQIVFGHRRFRALGMVGGENTTIDAIVREMSDLEADEAQVVENEKREDLQPLERARGYAGLIERHGLSVEDLALKLGKARSTVYRMLKLNSLDEKGKKALVDGVIPTSTAELLAQLPPASQGKATSDIITGNYGEPMSYRQALDHLKEYYFLDLRTALFDTQDKQLFPEAGACGTCQKRSDAQKDLFAQGKKDAPLCLDSPCWSEKTMRTAEAEAARRGLELLSRDVTEAVFSRWDDILPGQPYVKPSTQCPGDAKERSYKDLLTPATLKPLTVLAINHKHELVELLKTEGLAEAVTLVGKLKKKEPNTGSSSAPSKKKTTQTADEKAADAMAEELFRKSHPVVVRALVAAAEQRSTDKQLLKMMVMELWEQGSKYIADRRSLPVLLDEATFKKHFGKYSPKQLFGLIFELAFDSMLATPEEGDFGDGLVDVARVLKVDIDKLEKKVLAAQAGEALKDFAQEVKKEGLTEENIATGKAIAEAVTKKKPAKVSKLKAKKASKKPAAKKATKKPAKKKAA